MTLTKFMARSTWVAHAFEWEKLLKCHLKGKASKKLADGQNIDYSEKRKQPKAVQGLNTIIFKHVYWYMQQTQVSVYRIIGPLVFYFFHSALYSIAEAVLMSTHNLYFGAKMRKIGISRHYPSFAILKWDIIQLLPLSEGDMTICSPEAGNIARGQYKLSRVNKSPCHPHSRATIVLLYRTTFETN